MKNSLKILSLLLIGLLAISCSDDDSETPKTNLEDVRFAFGSSELPITIPSGLTQTQDPNALQTVGYLSTANLMQLWTLYLEVPQGATQSNTPIGRKASVNGRTQEDVLVYTWTFDDGLQSVSIAYQIGETSDKYTFEVFWKINGGEFQKFMSAEESKGELREGRLDIFIFDFDDSRPADQSVLTYTWRETATGQFFYDVSSNDTDDLFNISAIINPDGSGSLEVSEATVKVYASTWSANGLSGTFTIFGSGGSVLDSGTWG